jgi:hypothetical protein
MKSCPDCNSQKIVKDVIVLDKGDGSVNYRMQIAVDEKPDALIFKQRNYSEIDADVCADCGYIQFYAGNPKILWDAYQIQRNKVR